MDFNLTEEQQAFKTELTEFFREEMKDATTCANIYQSVLTDAPSYAASQWTDVSLGEAGRVADGTTNWWYNCRKSVFQIETYIQPRDDAAKGEAETFLAAMLGKIP